MADVVFLDWTPKCGTVEAEDDMSEKMADEVAAKLPQYPYTNLDDAILVGRAVKDCGGVNGDVSKSMVAQALNAEEDSTAFGQRLTSAKCYGVIQGWKKFTLTPAAKKFFLPQEQIHTKQALIEFVKSPPAFKAIIKKFDGNSLPAIELLANVFQSEGEVAEGWKDRVARFFNKAIKTAGVLDNGGALRVNAIEQSLKVGGPPAPPDGQPPATPPASLIVDAPLPAPAGAGTSAPFELYRFKGVILQVSEEITPEAWEKLNTVVKAIRPKGKGKGGK